jgi:translation initiation factor IF-2
MNVKKKTEKKEVGIKKTKVKAAKDVAKAPGSVKAKRGRPKTKISAPKIKAATPKPQPKAAIKPRHKPEAIKTEAKTVHAARIHVKPPKSPVIPKPKGIEKEPRVPAGQDVEARVAPPSPEPQKTAAPTPEVVVKPEPLLKAVEVKTPVSVKELAAKLSAKPSDLIKALMNKKIFATINQSLDEAIAREISKEFGYDIIRPPTMEEELLKDHHEKVIDKSKLVLRAPVVTFMGHVDHGKTSLLDYIRKTNVAQREHGGITQHIGAHEVISDKGRVTFLDTPGHEAFTAMRARGAQVTDVVVLVVAADDGIMPQTIEAVNHAKAAGVPIVVAVNKCDLPSANVEKVKKQLIQHELIPEELGGKTIVIPVSAKTGQGVNELLEMLLLEAELLELKANPNLKARGVVIEGHLSQGKGPVASVLVKNGTLRVGDVVLTGLYYGKIKAMLDDKGNRINAAPPSKPAEIMGLSGVPQAGNEFFVVKDEKKARTLSILKQDQKRLSRLASQKRITLEDIYSQAKEGKIKELKIILKADVQGSIEALGRSLEGLGTDQIKLSVIHSAAGNINDSDVILAAASNAVIIGFNVKMDEKTTESAQKENVEIKMYHIIYEAIADVRAAMEGMLEPIAKEVFLGRAAVKQIFRVSKVGVIAGCYIQKGTINRQAKIKLVRDKQVVYEGKISSLKRFKDDVKEVAEGFECGIGLAGHDDIKEGDLIEAHTVQMVARRL